MPKYILHITDIHAGDAELRDEDLKAKINGVERREMLGNLTSFLQALDLNGKMVFVIISGDLTIRGDEGGLYKVREWIQDRVADGSFPDLDRVIVVPGNHDVRRVRRYGDDESIRFSGFWEAFGDFTPHASIPGFDKSPLPEESHKMEIFTKSPLIGGLQSIRLNHGESINFSLPFVIDTESRIIVYAFNSAHGCGAPLAPNQSMLDAFRELMEIQEAQDGRDRVKKLTEMYLDSLIVDAGMIGAQQLTEFSGWMRVIQKQFPKVFHEFTKIAVLHHHVSHLWRQQLELKLFESVVDASQFKEYLVEWGFDLVLHGHKHTNHVGVDSSILPIGEDQGLRPLTIVSGGTVGGAPRLSDFQSFKIIEFGDEEPPYKTALIHEVPLQNAGNPGSLKESRRAKRYSVELKSSPDLVHKLAKLKHVFVKDLLDSYCKRYLDDGNFSVDFDVKTETRFKHALGEKFWPQCSVRIKGDSEEIFVHSILITKKISHEVISAIHWAVSESIAGGKSKVKRKVHFMIGDFSQTIFGREARLGESKESVEDLKRNLRAGLKAGSIQLTHHVYDDDRAREIARNELSRRD